MAQFRYNYGGYPLGLKSGMDAVLNKKFGTSTTYAPTTWADNINLLGKLPKRTASNNFGTFSVQDAADGVPIGAVRFNIPQTGEIYTKMKIKSCGVNLFGDVLEYGAFDPATGENLPTTSRKRSKGYTAVKPGLSFWVTCNTGEAVRIYCYDANMNYIDDSGYVVDEVFTVPANCFFIRMLGRGTLTDLSFNIPTTDHNLNTFKGEEVVIDWQEIAEGFQEGFVQFWGPLNCPTLHVTKDSSGASVSLDYSLPYVAVNTVYENCTIIADIGEGLSLEYYADPDLLIAELGG